MSDHIIAYDPVFHDLLRPGAPLQKLANNMTWTEGPAYFVHGDYLIWSDIPNNMAYKWSQDLGVCIFDDAPNYSNGHTIDRQGRLITCEHLTRSVTRRDHDGQITVIADSHAGKRLNSPNDVVEKSDGSIWFTDPPYGILSDHEGKTAPQEQDGCYVYRVDLGADEPVPVAIDFDKPNGLAFSRSESRLFISDTGRSHDPDGPHHIRVFDVKGNALSGGQVFAEIEHGLSDGFRVDVQDNLWTSTARGVSCYNQDGVLLGEILVPEVVSNLCFGGPNKDRMFITASTSLYAIYVGVQG